LGIANGVSNPADTSRSHPFVIMLGVDSAKVNDTFVFEWAHLPFALEKVDK
jgi:hypothetical protein